MIQFLFDWRVFAAVGVSVASIIVIAKMDDAEIKDVLISAADCVKEWKSADKKAA